MGVYTLPELAYDYSALEPHISARIMELHHSKHHQAYVTGANTALEQLAEAREQGNFAAVNAVMRELFSEPYPARTTIGVRSLPVNASVEIDAIMVID